MLSSTSCCKRVNSRSLHILMLDPWISITPVVVWNFIVTWMILFTLASFIPPGRQFATDWYSFSIISIYLWIQKVLNFELHGIDFCGSLKSVNNCSSGKTLPSIVFQGFVLGIFYKARRLFLPCLKALTILYVIWTPFKNKPLDSLENWYGHIMAGTSVNTREGRWPHPVSDLMYIIWSSHYQRTSMVSMATDSLGNFKR